MVYLAGPAAQRRHRPSSYRHFHAQSDLSNALDLALYLTGSERETRLYLRWLEERTRLLVESPLNWLRIEAVANALLEHGTLRAREIRKVASAALQRAPES